MENPFVELSKQISENNSLLLKINEKLDAFVKPSDPDELLTRKQTAAFFKVNLVTVHHWTKRGLLNPHGIGARVYYKKSELLKRLLELNPK